MQCVWLKCLCFLRSGVENNSESLLLRRNRKNTEYLTKVSAFDPSSVKSGTGTISGDCRCGEAELDSMWVELRQQGGQSGSHSSSFILFLLGFLHHCNELVWSVWFYFT